MTVSHLYRKLWCGNANEHGLTDITIHVCRATRSQLKIFVKVVKYWQYTNLIQTVSAQKDFDGATALTLAAGLGHVEVVKRLIAAGCDLDERNAEHATALIEATSMGHIEVG